MPGIFFGAVGSSDNTDTVGRNLYWVGGTASWDGTATGKWSLTSGGSSGEAEPTFIDNVHFDGNSGAVTVTVTSTFTCRNLDFTGFTGTFAGSGSGGNIYGSLTLAAGMTNTQSGALNFKSTLSGRTITSNGKALVSNVVFDGVGGGWTLQDAFNIGTSSITLTNGALNTNSQTVTCNLGLSSNNSNVRSLTLGSSTVNNSNGNYNFQTSTNFTLSAASATFNLSGQNSIDLGTTAATIGTINITTNATVQTSPSLINRSASDVTIGTLTRTNSSVHSPLLLSGNFTITNTLSFVGANISVARVNIVNANPGSTCRLTATGATKTFTNVDFYGITAVGDTPWTGTSVGDCGGNSGITADTPVTRYLVTAAGTNTYTSTSVWSTSSGGSTGASIPLPQDTIVIDSSSFGGSGRTLTLNGAPTVPGIDFTNATNNPTLAVPTQVRNVGDLKLISGMTASGAGTLIFNKWSSTQTLTTGGVSLPFTLQIIPGGTFALGDALTMTVGITYLSGTLNDGNFNVTSSAFNMQNTPLNTARTFNKGTGTYTLTGTAPWAATGVVNLTFTDAGTIKLTNNSASTKTFTPGGLTYNNFWNATAGSGVCIMNGGSTNSTWADFKIDAGRTQQFLAGTTTNIATFTASGGLANLTVINSSTSAAHTLNFTASAIVLTYMNITYSTATGAGAAASLSTDGGNNSGWVITP